MCPTNTLSWHLRSLKAPCLELTDQDYALAEPLSSNSLSRIENRDELTGEQGTHTAYLLCVLFDLQPTLLALRDNKVRNGGKEIVTLFVLCCKNTAQKLFQEMRYNKSMADL